jgi:S-adenosylmethionine-diacylglycerol 3-amino-3-carboxypropyl transferase
MRSTVLEGTDPGVVRYAQVWEDADVLLAGLDVRPGDVCVSIASAGDNTLALLTRQPSRVIALDVSPAQLACLELRVAAYRTLNHQELLELMGSRPSASRAALFARCRPLLGAAARAFWESRGPEIDRGIGSAGRFERYFALFRERILPLIHSRGTVESLLALRTIEERREFYDARWNTWRWRWLVRAFFSRFVMSRLGRDRAFFDYAEASLPAAILERARHALVDLDPSANPYAHWILTGTHGEALPCALRAENFDVIRGKLDRLEWHQTSLEEFVRRAGPRQFDKLNLSDVFEYVSPSHYEALLADIARRCRPGARLAYWNLLVPRTRPDSLAKSLRPLMTLAGKLHESDRAFFYSAFRIDEVVAC